MILSIGLILSIYIIVMSLFGTVFFFILVGQQKKITLVEEFEFFLLLVILSIFAPFIYLYLLLVKEDEIEDIWDVLKINK